jgi:phosphatidylserine/phosphatidylglycerophosphate/cardiolipin synthase-like enzyme
MSQEQEITVPIALSCTSSATFTIKWFVQNAEYKPLPSTYKPLVNGKEAFGAVYDAITSAKQSIDIICWGFQPSMYFKRGYEQSLCIGDLLIKKGQEGVKIRLLCWADWLHLAQVSENSAPGYDLLRGVTQNENNTQREYDRAWYYRARIAASPEQEELAGRLRFDRDSSTAERASLAERPLKNIQVVTRDFTPVDRAEIVFRQLFHRADKALSNKAVLLGTGAEPSHHQKMVLVDYELPDRAVGFVMGHNMLDAYWDDDAHRHARSHARFGRNGKTPRQDMSALVTGPVLKDLNANFCAAWKRSAKVDLATRREPIAAKLHPRCDMGIPVMAQITRTQSQEGRRDIKALYLQAVNKTTQFIYIENQYFRWEPLAQKIKDAASQQVKAGRDPGKHGPIHLFVVTNSSDEGMGEGTVSTYQMLSSLGRANQIPEVARLEQGDALASERLRTLTSLQQAKTADDAAAAQRKLDELDRQIADNANGNKPILPTEIPGLKVHICTLVAPDSPPGEWMPVYVHSKIMIIDDVFLTLGSANINTRSMEVDSELNICHEHAGVTAPLRKRLWGIHTNGMGAQEDAAKAFKSWADIIEENARRQAKRTQSPYASLIEFMRTSTKRSNLD